MITDSYGGAADVLPIGSRLFAIDLYLHIIGSYYLFRILLQATVNQKILFPNHVETHTFIGITIRWLGNI